jgi:hypothetical protein
MTCHRGKVRSPLCTTPSDSRWGLIVDQTAPFHTLGMLRGLPQVSKESILPIPQIVACNIWGVGPFSLGLLQGSPQSTLGISYCLLGLYGPVFWGCTILLWEGGLDGEATPPAWATGWRRLSGAWITAGVVGGVLYRGLGACWLPDPAIGMSLSHRFLTCDHHLPPWEHPPHRSARCPATSDGV